MSDSSESAGPLRAEQRGSFILFTAIGSAFFGVGADSMMKGDFIRAAISVSIAIIIFLVAFNWPRLSKHLPRKSVTFIGAIAVSAKFWTLFIFAVMLYLVYPLVYEKIYLTVVDPERGGIPSVTIQFNGGDEGFEILKHNNISVLTDRLSSQVVNPGECHKPAEPPSSLIYPAGPSFPSLFTPDICTPATPQDVYKTIILLAASTDFKAKTLQVNPHGARIPKYAIKIEGREAVLTFETELRNVVLDITYAP